MDFLRTVWKDLGSAQDLILFGLILACFVLLMTLIIGPCVVIHEYHKLEHQYRLELLKQAGKPAEPR